MIYTKMMGFGSDADELLAKRTRAPDTWRYFYQSFELIARGLGVEIDEITSKFDVAKATKDIPYTLGAGRTGGGVIKAGTVGGKPLMTYHIYWSMGADLEPRRDIDSRYQVSMAGDPPLEVKLMSPSRENGVRPFLGLPWTGLLGATALPAVCGPKPSVEMHIDLGGCATTGFGAA